MIATDVLNFGFFVGGPLAAVVALVLVATGRAGGSAVSVGAAVLLVIAGVTFARRPVPDRLLEESLKHAARRDNPPDADALTQSIRRQRQVFGRLVAAAGAIPLAFALAAL
jgi:hypothetical protein